MNQKRIPIRWLIETIDNRVNPMREEALTGVTLTVIEDLLILGLIDESKVSGIPEDVPDRIVALREELKNG